jgi:hypothetical protein
MIYLKHYKTIETIKNKLILKNVKPDNLKNKSKGIN